MKLAGGSQSLCRQSPPAPPVRLLLFRSAWNRESSFLDPNFHAAGICPVSWLSLSL